MMKTKSRIASIIKANNLDSSITGMPTFNLSDLDVADDPDFSLPINLRLGHLVEKVISELIKLSTNYRVLYENIQIIESQKTKGEIDFIIKDERANRLIHLELAYKFYLFDPSISTLQINNWIGPNRNDSLKEKLEKLKTKQFPLLYDSGVRSKFKELEIDKISQSLCFLGSLFIPYECKSDFNSSYQKAIKGYYLNFDTFHRLDNKAKTYFLPSKLQWGMDPSENQIWANFKFVEKHIHERLKEKQALLCWQKYKDSYLAFFLVWW